MTLSDPALLSAAERKTDHNILIKYLKDIYRNSNPASLFVRLKSASILEINIKKMILAVKLIT